MILGRAANVILGAENALRIRCIAPMSLRVQRNSKRLCIPLKEAEAATTREDNRRMKWVEELVGMKMQDPSQYDLTISTGQFSVDQAAALIVRSYRTLHGDKRGLPVKMLKAKEQNPAVQHGSPLWMLQGK